MHAYLIIAHNEFQILKMLLDALDDSRNDIYVHFDAKVDEVPLLTCKYSKLYVLAERKAVYWGDFSQVEAELLLYEAAYQNQYLNNVSYSYYHLISGVDIPLKSQDYIHDFFDNNQGKEFIGFFQGDLQIELKKKVQIFHLFPKYFSKYRNYTLRSVLRKLFTEIQLLLGISRNKDIHIKRGTNWVSITNDFVSFLLEHKSQLFRRYHHTFCADEIYKHTLCWNSDFKNRVYNLNDEALGCMREVNWIITDKGSSLPSFIMEDYDRLKKSSMIFARKFDSKNIDVVRKIISEL